MWNEQQVKLKFLGTTALNRTYMYVEDGSDVFCLSYIYGNPELKYRKMLWEQIISDSAACLYQQRPRLVLEILMRSEAMKRRMVA